MMAEEVCSSRGGHLWTVNSHEDWITVSETIGDFAWKHYNYMSHVKGSLLHSLVVYLGMHASTNKVV